MKKKFNDSEFFFSLKLCFFLPKTLYSHSDFCNKHKLIFSKILVVEDADYRLVLLSSLVANWILEVTLL